MKSNPKILFTMTLLLALMALATAQSAPTKRLVNVDSDGVALLGYDPVAYFTQGKPVRGSERIVSRHEGAVYRFASQEHKDLFDAEPHKYAPQYGGFCGYAVSRGYTAKISPDAFLITPDGRLVLQYDRSVLKKWNADPHNNLRKADENWPSIALKHGK